MELHVYLYIFFIHNNMGFLYVDANVQSSSLENKQVRKPNRTVDDLEQLCLWAEERFSVDRYRWPRLDSTRLDDAARLRCACVLLRPFAVRCVEAREYTTNKKKKQESLVLERRKEAAAVAVTVANYPHARCR